MKTEKLDAAQKHILKLIAKDEGSDGWTPISEMLFPHISKNTPGELAVFEKLNEGGRCKLTDQGREIVNAMAWI